MKRVFLLFCVLNAINVLAEEAKTTIIYGEDNRQDINQVNNDKIKLLSKSIAGRVFNFSFNKDEDKNKISFDEAPTLSSPMSAKVCSDQRFKDQKTAVDCTGFLVGEDLLVTAGHCVVDHGQTAENEITRDCAGSSWLFEYTSESDLNNVNVDDVYGCKKVILGKNHEVVDFALIQLDRKVVGRKPLKIAEKNISLAQKIFVMGHPSGLPLKYADGARVFETEEAYFATNLDTFGGNSGSPVFNADTLEVEGILVRGDTDYIVSFEDNGERCRKVNTCDNERENCQEEDPNILGEHVTYISLIKDSL